MQVQQLTSPDELRSLAAAWDRLWERCEVSLATVRAELVAEWLEHFRPHARARILVVENGSELAAAIPLVQCRQHGILPVADLTANHWFPSGDLLLDPACDTEAALAALIAVFDRLPWPLLWLEQVPVETPRWQAFLRALPAAGLRANVHLRYRVGQIDLRGDYQTYEAQRARHLRYHLRKDLRHLEQLGPVKLKVLTDIKPQNVDTTLREAFEIEDRSWKTHGGLTVLRAPGMFDFYCRQARQLAAQGRLCVSFLELAGRPIAFQVGSVSKGIYHAHKTSYDDAYRRYGPGNLLMTLLTRYLFFEPGVEWLDFQGPLVNGFARWSTHTYPIARVIVAPGRLASRALFTAYQMAAPAVRFLRKQRVQARGGI